MYFTLKCTEEFYQTIAETQNFSLRFFERLVLLFSARPTGDN